MADPRTLRIYDDQAKAYAQARQPVRASEAVDFGREVAGWRADLGCGAGRYTAELGHPVVGLDASAGMLAQARLAAPDARLVLGDLARPPFRRGSLAGGWASMSYHHLPRRDLPLALARLHHVLAEGAPVDLTAVHGDYEGHDLPGDDFPGRWFSCLTESSLTDLLVGAGFDVTAVERRGPNVWARATRAVSLADTVAPGMRLLACGLNPSLHSARAGFGYAGPGNRFWPALRRAGLIPDPADPGSRAGTGATPGRRRASAHVDPEELVLRHGIGMTDLVKRATPRAAELGATELREGMARVTRLVEWLAPAAVVFVGMQGYRAAIDRSAQPGWQASSPLAAPTYLMPSTSGLNAATSLDELAQHLAAAASAEPGA